MKKLFLLCLPLIIISTLTYGGTVSQIKEPTEAMKFDPATKYIITITTPKGNIVAELNTEKAPLTSTNFINLINNGFYNGLTFHRVVPNFVIQGGDPLGNGTGGPGYTVKGEVDNSLLHSEGSLAMARTGDQVNPQRRSSGSQFYITLADVHQLDGQYTVFGKVIEGMDVVKKIAIGDKMTKVTLATIKK